MSPNRTVKTDLRTKAEKLKETRAQRADREKREMEIDSSRKIVIRRLIKAIKESSLTTEQIEELHKQFREVR